MRPGWKTYVLLFWLLLIAGVWLVSWQQGMSPVAFLRQTLTALRHEPLAPLYLFALYLIRPLLLLPISLLTIASGMIFGVLWGLGYALVASLMSSTLSYAMGLFLAKDVPTRATWLERLRRFPFETVLLCRVLAVPGDLVNIAAGYLKVPLWAFWVATAIGGLPGLVMAVLAGASFDLEGATVNINRTYLVASGLLLAASLLLSAWLRRRSRLLD